MTFEDCLKILPDELTSLGYKMKGNIRNPNDETIINFHLDELCNDCLVRIVNPNRKHEKCICYAEKIHATDWNRYFYSEFSDEVYNKLMNAARNMVAQYKKYHIDLKIDELSKDFV